jgi:drug/metabolite transporter (DMT)-like permease
MKNLLPIVFATIAAIGNAMFALGQKKSVGMENGLLFVALSAMVAVSFSLFLAPLVGEFDIVNTIKGNSNALIISGSGLFFTYLGFNLLYSRYGTSQYVLYAVLSIITTTIIVGIFWLKEPVNVYHKLAIAMALAAVVLFSIGQSKVYP